MISQAYHSLCVVKSKLELGSDVYLSQGIRSPVLTSLLFMALRSSQWLFIKVFCAALLKEELRNPIKVGKWQRQDKWEKVIEWKYSNRKYSCFICKQNTCKKTIIPLEDKLMTCFTLIHAWFLYACSNLLGSPRFIASKLSQYTFSHQI